jgi:hypothetical protein
VPIGAGVFGRVRSSPGGPPGQGRDRDHDGLPGLFDVDDDGDLRLDLSELPSDSPRARLALIGAPGLEVGCPALVCSGRLGAGVVDAWKLDAALLIAIGATLLALLSLALQLRGALGRRSRTVRTEVRLGLPIYQQGGGEWAVFVEVSNDSQHPVRWVSAALEARDGRAMYLLQQPAGGELPAVIGPRESHATWARCSDLERSGLDLGEPLAAVVKLASGETMRSKRRRLVSRSGRKRR